MHNTKLHADNSRLLKWVHTRMWNIRANGQSISTSEIIAEMSGYFDLNLSPYQIENLKRRIDRIRNTVNKKYIRHERIRERVASDWRTDIRLIIRWERAGIIKISNPIFIEKITEMLRERDYVFLTRPDEIHIDPDIKLWDRF
jgi:hypothetical protein